MTWSYTTRLSPAAAWPSKTEEEEERHSVLLFQCQGAGGGRSEILALQTAATNLPKSESGPTQDGATVRKLEINSRADNLGN